MNLLQKKQEEMLISIGLLDEKIAKYHLELIIACTPDVKFNIEKHLEQAEEERRKFHCYLDDIIQQINQIEDNECQDLSADANGDNILEIIGFDLGHGETAIARTTSQSSSEPKSIDIINNKNSIITAVALDSKKGILIGDDAYCYNNIDSLKVLFKSHHFSDLNTSEPINFFVYKCLQLLKSSGKITNDKNTYFFVGSPAGWTTEDREQYSILLKKSGMKNVVVVPESRAAFLDAKESGALNETVDRLVNSVLIIDIGSSTTDFTVVKNYKEKPLDFGYNKLGAGLIDISIFNLTIDKHEEQREVFKKMFNDYPSVKARCLLKCREVKEKYFAKSNELDWASDSCHDSERILTGDHFDIDIYKSDMDRILSMPITELDNKTWPDAFRSALIKCKDDKEYQSPKLVLLTGGGSRMRFTYDICREIFSESIVKVGLEPHLTIAKGLAVVGRTDFKIKLFRQEIEGFIHSEKLLNTVRDEFPKLFKLVSTTFFNLCCKIGLENFRKWSEGEFDTLHNMEQIAVADIDALIKEQGERIFTKDIIQWLAELNPKIEALTYDICDKYNISRKSLAVIVAPASVELDMEKFKHVVKLGDSITTAFSVVLGGIIYVVTTILSISLADTIAGVIGTMIAIAGSLGGGFLGLIVGFIAKDYIDDFIRDKFLHDDIPVRYRNILFSENKFKEKMEEKRSEIEITISQAIEKEFNAQNKFNEVVAAIRQDLNARADEACVLIK